MHAHLVGWHTREEDVQRERCEERQAGELQHRIRDKPLQLRRGKLSIEPARGQGRSMRP